MSVVVLAATALPLVRDPVKGDDFPLSTYPMFAERRSGPQTLEYAVGYAADGTRRAIPPEAVASYEIMQAGKVIEDAVRARRTPALCAQIAAAVGGDVVRVEIVRGTHDPLAYLLHDVRGPEQTLATCEVPR